MRFIFAFCFFTCGYQAFGQYDNFDFETGHDSYKNVFSRFSEERINGQVKELKRGSKSEVYLHVELNRNHQIVKEHEYADTLHLSRTKTYSKEKITKETEYRDGTPSKYIHYKYDKSGNLISRDFLTNKTLTSRVTYQYDKSGRLLFRNYSTKNGFDQFIYDGDTVIWKLTFNEKKVLKEVISKIRREKIELIIFHKLDTTSDVYFKQRIKPIREYQKKWDDNKNITETSEFAYDSVGNKIAKSFKINQFNSNKLVKSISNYNTDLLKGEFTTEFFYNNQGLLDSEVSKHGNRVEERKYEYDEHGNCILLGSFTYRFLYDKNENWTIKQRFNKKNSSSTEIISGETMTKKYTEDTWTDEEKRNIIYFD
jgi:hypothetical protein